MAGYTRNDTSNNIASGNVINASDLDGEFDAIVAAFNASTGHVHDGTAANGAPITKLGPVQEYVGDSISFSPKTTATYNLGTTSLRWNNAYIATLTLTNPLSIASGGTNSSATPTSGGIGYGTGTALAYTSAGTSGQVLTSNGSSAPTWNTTVSSVAMTVPSFLSISGSPITSSGTLAVSYSGTALPVANGGTGRTTLTANNVILGNGTSTVNFVAPGTTGNVLTSNGTTWTSAAGVSLATPLAVVGNATAGAEIRLPEDTDNGSNYAAIKAPNSLASNVTLTLPSTTGTLGYLNIPSVGNQTADYTLSTSDIGKYVPTTSSITIADNVFSSGDVVMIVNNSSGSTSIFRNGSGNMYIAGINTTRTSVSLATRGIANILFLDGTNWIVSGNVT